MTDYTAQLRSLMQSVGLVSFRALSRAAAVSDWQIDQLRKGQIRQMRVEVLLKLSQTLQISIDKLLASFSDQPIPHLHGTIPETTAAINAETASEAAPKIALETELQQLHHEYQRLQSQLAQQRDQLQQEFQQACLQILESWLLQFPTAAYAAQQNPELPAVRLLPLMRPIEQLLKTWQVEILAPVGAELPYNPQHHQLMEGNAAAGETVKIRYAGYLQGDRLLYRAKVIPVGQA